MIIENSGYTCISKTSDNSLLLLTEFGQCNEIRNAKLKMMDQTGLVPLQSCFSCTRVRDDSTLHSSITAIFVGTSRLIPPGERLSRHCSPRPEAGANTPLQITLLISDYILSDTRALLQPVQLGSLQRRAPRPSFCTSTREQHFSPAQIVTIGLLEGCHALRPLARNNP